MEKNQEYYNAFEKSLEQELLKVCTSLGVLEGTLLASDDIDAKWKEMAPEYMVDAVREIMSYPEVAVSWASYMGCAVAQWWDSDWGRNHNKTYRDLYGDRGFDNMDDHIVRDILGYELSSNDAKMLVDIFRACAHTTLTKIRREQIEWQTTESYMVLAMAAKTMFRIGAAIHLHKLGYKFQKVQFDRHMN